MEKLPKASLYQRVVCAQAVLMITRANNESGEAVSGGRSRDADMTDDDAAGAPAARVG